MNLFFVTLRFTAAAFSISLLVLTMSSGNGYARDCPDGVTMPSDMAILCDAFVEYVASGTRPVDDRIAKRFPPAGINDPPIRSFAVVVSVWNYPNAVNPKDRALDSIKIDQENLIEFLKEQQFDEIIVLSNDMATPSNIGNVLENYIYPLVNGPYKGRARFFFAFDGHGTIPDDPSLPGGLALSPSLGENDNQPDHVYPLSRLQSDLSAIAAFAYQSLALLGSCYSGSIFPSSSPTGVMYITNSQQPGAHVLTAADSTERAWTGPAGKGTIFFDEILSTVRKAQPTGIEADTLSASDAVGNVYLRGGFIVRLGAVLVDVNSDLENLTNPNTGAEYPQIVAGQMAPNKNYTGAFFFLGAAHTQTVLLSLPGPHAGPFGTTISGPRGAEIVKVEAKDSVPNVPDAAEDTGSAIIGHPDIKVFNFYESYRIRGADISQFNERVDFDGLYDDGLRFVYIMSTQGAERIDQKFRSNWVSARASKLRVGAYHVFSFCQSAESQHANIVNNVPVDPNSLPLAIDVEWYGNPALPNERECTDVASIKRNLQKLNALVEETYGKPPVIYTSSYSIPDIVGEDFNRYALWFAKWQDSLGRGSFGDRAPSMKGSNPWTLWQVRPDARAKGIDGPFNLDVFFGTQAQFDAFSQGHPNIAIAAALGGAK